MTNLLIKLFIKSPRDTSSPAVRRAYGTLVSTVGIILNLLPMRDSLVRMVISSNPKMRNDVLIP